MCVSYVMVSEVMANEAAKALAASRPDEAMRALLAALAPDARDTQERTYPRRLAPVIVQESQAGEANTAGSFGVQMPSWGFEAPPHSDLVFNTRIESALGGVALWKRAVEEGRAIVWAQSFFENHGTETIVNPRTGRTKKQPYRFELVEQPLLMAALVQDGRYSVITQPAVGDVEKIHARMPLLMDANAAAAWLLAEADWRDIAADQTGRFAEALTATKETMVSGQPSPAQDAQQLQLF